MTYYEVLHRMVEIMYIDKIGWIHPSYCTRTYEFLLRAEQRLRFLPTHTHTPVRTHTHIPASKRLLETNPRAVLEDFSGKYLNVHTQLLASEEVDYFVQMCRDGGKPVNFIPVIDKGVFALRVLRA